MTTIVDKGRIVAALDEVWSSIRELIGAATPDAWGRPTDVPGWDVQANVAHIIGTEQMLLGEPAPDVSVDRSVATHVRNDIGEMNEVWVQALSQLDPPAVLELYDRVTARRLASLAEIGDDEWNAETMTPAGRDSYGRFMRIRVFDCWFHEQDIRAALRRPGHDTGLAVDVTLDEMASALGFVVGKRAGVPAGRSVAFVVTDDAGGRLRTVHVEVTDRARVLDSPSGPATVTLTLPVVTFARLCGGRVIADQVRDRITVDGDRELGDGVLSSLAYTI